MLGLKETLDGMAKANGLRWYGHVIRRNNNNILKKAMILEVNGKRKRGRPKMTWRRQVEESVEKVGLKVEEAADRTRWREGVRAIAEGMSPAIFGDEKRTGLKLDMMMYRYFDHSYFSPS